MQRLRLLFVAALLTMSASACHWVDWEPAPVLEEGLTLQEIAMMFSELPIEKEQMQEVLDAVVTSSDNGYDEEYMMSDLFNSPGSGVRASMAQTKAPGAYPHPLKNLIREYLGSRASTKSGAGESLSTDKWIEILSCSDAQIYWPYHDLWDGNTLPVITFDPGGNLSAGTGYEIVAADDGSRSVRKVTVTEAMARKRPVWVINTNDDSDYTSVEMLRRADPDWGAGGDVTITKSVAEGDFRTLVLKDFMAHRNFDSWFTGASEFWVKCGSVEGFTASTEAEMRLYTPSITDFMIVVRRSQIGEVLPFNAVLVSEWTDQVEQLAFMMIEDDGGTRSKWDFDITVKVQSKSYGITVSLPVNIKDDIVWRGALTSRYFEKYTGQSERFGDVSLTFEIRS